MNHLGNFVPDIIICNLFQKILLHCVLILVKRDIVMIWNESGGKKSNQQLYGLFSFSFNFYFSFNWKQYVVSAVLYILSIMGITMVLGDLTRKYDGRVRRFIRDVWISYLETQQQDDIEMDRMDGTQPSSPNAPEEEDAPP